MVGRRKPFAHSRADHSVLSFTLILEGLTIVPRAVLERELDFKSFSIRSIVANLDRGAVGLAMALKGSRCLGSGREAAKHRLVGPHCTLETEPLEASTFLFSQGLYRDLLGYSVGSFTGNLGVWMNSQIDTLIIGLFFGPVTVGFTGWQADFPS